MNLKETQERINSADYIIYLDHRPDKVYSNQRPGMFRNVSEDIKGTIGGIVFCACIYTILYLLRSHR